MRSLAISISLVAASLVAACSGKVSGSPADGGTSGNVDDTKNNPSTGPQGALVAACPSSKPTLGASCSPVGQLCEYGDDVSSQCNFVAHCSPDAVWESVSGDGCTTTLPTCDSNVATDGTCAADPPCQTSEGICTCIDESGPGQSFDGGAPPHAYAWQCGAPATGCPAWPKRPRIGSACSTPDLLCDYSPCGAYGFAFRCDSAGYWDDAFSQQCGGG